MNMAELHERLHLEEYGVKIPITDSDWEFYEEDLVKTGECCDGEPTIRITGDLYYFAITWELGWYEQSAGEIESVDDALKILSAFGAAHTAFDLEL